MDNKEKFKIVKKYVDKMDYMDLLSAGCPNNEYDGESNKIADTITESMTVEDIALLIINVFARSFNTGIDISDPNNIVFYDMKDLNKSDVHIDDSTLKVARNIYEELHNKVSMIWSKGSC